MTWPEALMVLAIAAHSAFIMWLFARSDRE
jgi:hypothetical protein